MDDIGSLTALLVEPHQGMRGNLQNMLNLCGITKIDQAVSAGTAIRPLKTRPYDIILCEYDLGDGQNGQQLLEDLRHHKIIPLSSIFFMVTAERSYEKVVSAVELAPSEYLLKPFAADALLERLTRAIERRMLFMPTYQLMDAGDPLAALDACIDGEAQNARFATDFNRLRGDLHVLLGQAAEAEVLYRSAFEFKPAGWSGLGLAKSLFMQNRLQESEELLQTLVSGNSQFLDAYDLLAKVHQAAGRLPEAKGVLASAVAISPHVVKRLRNLGDVAMETGDVELAEKSFEQVVSKIRFSEFRDPEDHVKLVKTLIQKGDVQRASSVARDLERTMRDTKKTEVCRALSAGLIHEHAGDTERATAEFGAAARACRDGVVLSNEIKLDLATSCLKNNLEDDASEILLEVMNNASDGTALARAMKAFEQAGRKDIAEAVSKESRRQVIGLVSSGAEKAKQGDYRGAVALMTEAAHKFPDNPQVVFNAALSLLKCLDSLGWDISMAEQARWYIDSCRRVDPANSRLTPLADFYQTVLKKYGVPGSRVAAKLPARE